MQVKMLPSVFLLLLTIWSIQKTGSAFDMGVFNIPKMMNLPVLDDQLLFNLTNLLNSVSQKGLNLTECYNPMIGQKEMDIFTTDFMNVLTHFMDLHKDIFTVTDTAGRIKTFMESIMNLVNLIVECVAKPEDKRTKFGVTGLSAYSHDEFKQMLGTHPLSIKPNETTRTKRSQSFEISGFEFGPDGFKTYDDDNTDPSEILNHPNPNRQIIVVTHDPLPDGYKVEDFIQTAQKGCDSFFNYEDKIPSTFDWRDQGIVTPVKRQGDCGSCFIFAATAATESAYMHKHGADKMVDFSEQALVDCVFPEGDVCDHGGTAAIAWLNMQKNGVIDESSLPYQEVQHECQEYPHAAEIDDYCQTASVNPLPTEHIQMLALQKGPVTVGIDAEGMQFLKGEFHYGDACTEKVNHAVLLVGWNEQYWIIKNSWNTDWGVDGYLYLDRTQYNLCGFNSEVGAVWVK